MQLTKEQQQILDSESKRVVVSASAGSGKTFVLVEKLISLICNKKVPVSRLLVLTFTKAAAQEMKSRLMVSLLGQKPNDFVLQQIDDLSISDISTIDSFCEKIIKRNIDKLPLDEGFTIIDERSANGLKKRAFVSAFEKFSKNQEMFDSVYYAFKKNKERIEECVIDMNGFFDSLSNESQIRQNFFENFDVEVEKAKEYLVSYIYGQVESATNLLMRAQMFVDIPEKAKEFITSILNQIKLIGESDLYELCRKISNISLPDLPRNKMDASCKRLMARAKEIIKDLQTLTDNYANLSTSQIKAIEGGDLTKALLNLYGLYIERYSRYKNSRSVLDFADIERYAYQLLQNEGVKKTLQEKYDYIFIDEYQDTNSLQECILKPIAEGGYFTAVGDIKQGIYGFRNARKEIMLKDIEEFSSCEDGQALYLTGNFRTDKNILSFVNDVFCKIMTKDSSGIEYQEKSMLEGLQKFENDGLPPVSVDVVCSPAKEKAVREGIYSVEEEELEIEGKFDLEVQTIEARIDEVLGKEIYDAKNKVFRPVKQSDIALLFRNRCPLMKESVKYLQAKGYSIEADIKNDMLDDAQMRVLVALLKLTLNKNDDISLAAVMASAFGGFSISELARLRQTDLENDFHKIVLSSLEQKVVEFLQMVNEFSRHCQIFGITKAFQKLFEKYAYYDYLKSLSDAGEKLSGINQLFKMIKEMDCEYKVSNLLSIIETNAKIKGSGEGNVDSLGVYTIHATKGLEYPIVILCGCGESLSKVYNKNYILTNSFGLGTAVYDYEDNNQFYSPMFLAGKLAKQKEEFEGELMIFYVALTRAQNHLFIIGNGKEKDFTFDDIAGQNNYLKLIMLALGENFSSQLFSQGEIFSSNRRFQVISEITTESKSAIDSIKQKNKVKNFQAQIEEYQKFDYANKANCKINYKNSVTGILKLSELEAKYEKEESLKNNNSVYSNSRLAIAKGNAYHEALKLIDLKKVVDQESFKIEFKKIIPLLNGEYISLINENILYNNIILINKLSDGLTTFKEREFIMSAPLKDIGLIGEGDVIVQGIVDFFAIGKKNILIDYKFTSLVNPEEIKNRYQKQIELYSKAIEEAFNITLDEKYLLSLKNSQLIKL